MDIKHAIFVCIYMLCMGISGDTSCHIELNQEKKVINDTFPEFEIGLESISLGEFWEVMEKKYIDSLNVWTIGENLPEFINEVEFDKYFSGCIFIKGTLSMRKRVFRQVTNKEVLKKDEDAFIINPPESINKCLTWYN